MRRTKNPRWSKVTYQMVADILRENRIHVKYTEESEAIIDGIASDLARVFTADNSRFDIQRFYRAIGVDSDNVSD